MLVALGSARTATRGLRRQGCARRATAESAEHRDQPSLLTACLADAPAGAFSLGQSAELALQNHIVGGS